MNKTDMNREEKIKLIKSLLDKKSNSKRPSYPLSSSQKRLWFLSQFENYSRAYNQHFSLRLLGEVDDQRIEKVFKALVNRHGALRTSFAFEYDTLRQRIKEDVDFKLTVSTIDSDSIYTTGNSNYDDTIIEYINNFAEAPFSLNTLPLFRVGLFRLSKTESILVLSMHHIIVDALSMRILVSEFVKLFNQSIVDDFNCLNSLKTRYVDYCLWEERFLESKPYLDQLSYWEEKLKDVPSQLNFPFQASRPKVQSFIGRRQYFSITMMHTKEIYNFSSKYRTTPFMTLLSAYYVLLSRYTGDNDISIGSTISNRNSSDSKNVVGCYINNLVLREKINQDIPFLRFLDSVKDTCLEAYSNKDVPFEKVVERISPDRSSNYSPLIQVLFTFQGDDSEFYEVPSLNGLDVEFIENPHKGAMFDISLWLTNGDDGIRGYFEHNEELISRSTAQRFSKNYKKLLEEILRSPKNAIRDIELISDEERELIIRNSTGKKDSSNSPKLLHRFFERQVHKCPSSTSVIFDNKSLSFSDLNKKANQLSNYLLDLGLNQEDPVVVLMDRSLELVVTILAVLKSGGSYVPIDPSFPVGRVESIMEEVNPPIAIVDRNLKNVAESVTLIHSCHLFELIKRFSTQDNDINIRPKSCCYILFTSGSTGKPKGVINSHEALCNRILWMQGYSSLNEQDCIIQKTSIGFDVSLWEFLLPLVAGSKLVLALPNKHKDPYHLETLINRYSVTVVHFVPSMLKVFLQATKKSSFPSLKHVFCSGEELNKRLESDFTNTHGRVHLHNLYGPTEAAIDVSYWKCLSDRLTNSVPIGKPITNTRLYILDDNLNRTPIGVDGELYIEGVQVARGYLYRPSMTAERFIPSPFSKKGDRIYRTGDLARLLPCGNIEFRGRIDRQVKKNGVRIELEEIEQVIASHQYVNDVVVAAKREDEYSPVMVAFVKYRGQEGCSKPNECSALLSQLEKYVRNKLPESMVPNSFVSVAEFPYAPTGKIDYKQLFSKYEAKENLQHSYAPPETDLESTLCQLWSDVLGVDRVGIFDSFFSLGGDSIRSIVLVSRARELNICLDTQLLYEHQTIREITEHIELADNSSNSESIRQPFRLISERDRLSLSESSEDAFPATSLQKGILFHQQSRVSNSIYHDVFSYTLSCQWDRSLFNESLKSLIIRHPILRAYFKKSTDGETIVVVKNHIEAPFHCLDISNKSQYERKVFLSEFLKIERNSYFDLYNGPLFRIFVHVLDRTSIQYTLSFNHGILDGWSVARFNYELFSGYQQLMRGENITFRSLDAKYSDYVEREIDITKMERASLFWDTFLQGAIPSYLFDISRNIDRNEPKIANLKHKLESGLSKRIADFSVDVGVPSKTVLFAAHLRTLSYLSNTTDLISGLVTHGRSTDRDSDKVLGLFLNTLPFRTKIKNISWIEFVKDIFIQENKMIPYACFPYAVIQQKIGIGPLFNVIFNFVDFHIYDEFSNDTDITLKDSKIFEETNYEFVVNISREVDDNYSIDLHYNEHSICKREALRFFESLRISIDLMTKNPCALIESEPLLTENDIELKKHESLKTQIAHPFDKCLHELFEQRVQLTPYRTALVENGNTISFHSLNIMANRIARYLQSFNLNGETAIGIYMQRGYYAIASMLAVMKLGKAFLALEPKLSNSQLRYMVTHSGIAYVLQSQVSSISIEHVVQVNVDSIDERSVSSNNLGLKVSSNSPAYIIYTSGSTGRPKGVIGTHKGTLNRFNWMWREYPFSNEDIICHKTALSFVDSIWEVWGALIEGVKLVILGDETVLNVDRFIDALIENRVTRLVVVPTYLRVILNEIKRKNVVLSDLKICISSGEELTADLAEIYVNAIPKGRLLNLYGSSEVSADVTCFEYKGIDLNTEKVPIGTAIDNTDFYILDRSLNLLPKECSGELFVGGSCLSSGYLNDPATTAESFIPHPFRVGERLYRTGDLAVLNEDNQLVYLGRKDRQIKFRGIRVDLSEIETYINSHEYVESTTVTVLKDELGHLRIVAYIIFAKGASISIKEVYTRLKSDLPRHMLPNALLAIDKIPLTASGKIDIARLPQPNPDSFIRTEYAPPRSMVETKLYELWCVLLNAEGIGIDDDFFDVGGHSIIAMKLISRIEDKLSVKVDMLDVFHNPTIREIATLIENKQWINKSRNRFNGLDSEVESF